MTTKIIKNIYSRNNNVCLGVCGVVFMCIITFKKIIFSMKRGYLRVFMSINAFKNYF